MLIPSTKCHPSILPFFLILISFVYSMEKLLIQFNVVNNDLENIEYLRIVCLKIKSALKNNNNNKNNFTNIYLVDICPGNQYVIFYRNKLTLEEKITRLDFDFSIQNCLDLANSNKFKKETKKSVQNPYI
ncbi:hypothetical protein Mgra_00010110 [Meloidogyne graminicola]|uniref:Uncharacterized protein n=1 Tax=Meloidogyne graminicola TaxID=189291 RepID=A0A8S9Z7P5_9BILA|nr:hypothetical protein Mgra_00010110 [Meloidogyne graminicola]